MKKLSLKGKLNLNKETITKLNNAQMGDVKGGGLLSLGLACSTRNCGKVNQSRGLFCSATASCDDGND